MGEKYCINRSGHVIMVSGRGGNTDRQGEQELFY